jgi:hypothetical protein
VQHLTAIVRRLSLLRHHRLCFARQKIKMKVQKQDPAINRRGGAQMKPSKIGTTAVGGGVSRLSHELIRPENDREGVDGIGANAGQAARPKFPA